MSDTPATLTPTRPTPASGSVALQARPAEWADAHEPHATVNRQWLLATDILAVAVSSIVLLLIRESVADMGMRATISRACTMLLFGLLLVVRLGIHEQYDRTTRFMRFDDMLTLARAAFIASAITVFMMVASNGFFTGYIVSSRSFLAAAFLVPTMALGIVRLVGHRSQSKAFAQGRAVATTLIIGDGNRARRFSSWLGEQTYLGLRGVLLSVASTRSSPEFQSDLGRLIDQLRPDEITLAFEQPNPQLQVAVLKEASYRGIAVKVLPGVFESYQSSYFEYGGVPVTTLFATPRMRFARRFKAVGDRLFSILGLVALSPLLALIALGVWLQDRGPVFYRQERVGLHGTRFQIWKFRSMRPNADAVLEDHLAANPHLRAEWETFQKLPNDPRVTRLGQFLRTWSLDELPQLLNVATGDMSIVGPRPPMVDQLDHYGLRFVFSQAKPGITGLWQVSGRNELSFEERIELEVYYVENWSFRLDLLILLKTIRVILRRDGAY